MTDDNRAGATGVADTEQLSSFRAGFYRCLNGWADAAFELTDAVLCSPAPVTSVTVVQQAQQAFLQWQTLDVGKNTALVFDQGAAVDLGGFAARDLVDDLDGAVDVLLGVRRGRLDLGPL